MSFFSAGQLQVWTGGSWHGGEPNAVRSFSNDTRQLAPNACFVALRTDKRDGHDFLAAAAQAGATAALVERVVADVALPQLVVGADNGGSLAALQRIAAAHRLRLRAPVFGVTGSAGKTSTKDLLAAVLGAQGFATAGNLNNFLGVPLMLLKTSPAQHRAGVVIEAGMSQLGEMKTLASVLQPDIAIVTNVLPAHLEGVGSLDAIAREKATLFRHVRTGGVAVFPATLLRYAAFREATARLVPVRFCGEAEAEVDFGAAQNAEPFDVQRAANSVGADLVEAELMPRVGGGTDVRLNFANSRRNRGAAGEFFEFSMPECPAGMVRNAVLAATAAVFAGIAFARVRAAVAAWRPSARRGEILMREGRLFYVDCYNANPASMLDAARAFSRQTEAESARVFVLGGMNELGATSAYLHRKTGAKLPLRTGDALVLFGGDAPEIGHGAAENGFPNHAIHLAPDIETVRALIARLPGPVFLKGSRSRALERALEPNLG